MPEQAAPAGKRRLPSLSDNAVDLVRQKADALGDGSRVTLHEQFAGFDRLGPEPRLATEVRSQAQVPGQ